jgi:predicted nucleotidyltransferase
METTRPVSPIEEFASYLPAIRRRWLADQETARQRQTATWEAARQAASLLRIRFGAQKVIAFGSLVRSGRFSERSDIDLAVSGIPPVEFFRTWDAVASSCPFDLDLVDLADCSPALRDLLEQEGVAL